MILARPMLLMLLLMILQQQVQAQDMPADTALTIDVKSFPHTRLVFTDSLYSVCGYYDALNNILYDCNGKIALDKPVGIRKIMPDSLCCSLKDTDSDGVNDEMDKCINEKGPVSNYGCPIIDNSVMFIDYPAMPNVYFTTGSSYLSPASIKALKKSVEFLNEWPDMNLSLEAHADNKGSDALNRNLCMARMNAVRHYLLKAGIDKNRITYSIYGSKYPIADPRTKEGRAMNRRVEIRVYKKSTAK